MKRKVYIIPKGWKPQEHLTEAADLDCPEIIKGVPPVFKHLFTEQDLPVVYEEPEATIQTVLTPTEVTKAIQELRARVTVLELEAGIK